MPDTLQGKHGNTAENIADFFCVGEVPISIHEKAPLHFHVPPVNAAGALPSSLESQTSDAGKITDRNIRHSTGVVFFSSLAA